MSFFPFLSSTTRIRGCGSAFHRQLPNDPWPPATTSHQVVEQNNIHRSNWVSDLQNSPAFRVNYCKSMCFTMFQSCVHVCTCSLWTRNELTAEVLDSISHRTLSCLLSCRSFLDHYTWPKVSQLLTYNLAYTTSFMNGHPWLYGCFSSNVSNTPTKVIHSRSGSPRGTRILRIFIQSGRVLPVSSDLLRLVNIPRSSFLPIKLTVIQTSRPVNFVGDAFIWIRFPANRRAWLRFTSCNGLVASRSCP